LRLALSIAKGAEIEKTQKMSTLEKIVFLLFEVVGGQAEVSFANPNAKPE